MDAATARLTVGPEVLALAASLPPYDAGTALELAQRLRDGGGAPAVVSAAMTQSRLRTAATGKFGDFAAGMLLSQDGLEQATRLTVAARHAQRYRAAGVAAVADLTCGIGADSMAMAALGIAVLAFERDEATALLADHNLRHWPDARVVHADAMETLAAGDIDVEGVFADPARRTARGRRHDPADYSPPLDAVLALRERWPELGVKVGPAIPHDAVPPETEAQWVSVAGEVVEAGLWTGRLARRHGHSALVLRGDESHVFDADPTPGDAGPLGAFVAEPDGAIIRAGLVGPLAATVDAHLLDPRIAYLTAEAATATPFATWFEVSEVVPFSVKRLGAALAARGVGTVEIKKRGMDLSPERLRAELRLRGEASATVIITRVGSKRLALICDRVAR